MNIATFVLDFPNFIPDFDFFVSYLNHDVRYEEEEEFEGSEYNADTISANILYAHPFLPVKIASGFLFYFQQYYSDNDFDNTKKDIPFDIEWKINPKHDFYVKTHYKTSNYESNSPVEDFDGWEIMLGGRYYIIPVSTVDFMQGEV